ncbi:MAG: DUF4276 family protein [Gammaproteobacteria bacterium]|nr:DUF4276 family protein [Gammaproteobacteria bacterium]
MIEVIAVCEGRTEEAFLNEILYHPMLDRSVLVKPRLIATSSGHAGGALTRQRVLRSLRSLLRGRKDTYVTTLFDLYGLPSDFPGRAESALRRDPLDRAAAIEAEFRRVVVQAAECRADRFFPHIQPYEFEALLFSDATKIAETEDMWSGHSEEMQRARRGAQSPEHIDDGPATHPSARLKSLSHPPYNKVVHGIAIARRVGLDRIRAECHHFNEWLTRLENLSPIGKKG